MANTWGFGTADDDQAPTNLWMQRPSGVGGVPGPMDALAAQPPAPAPAPATPGVTLNTPPPMPQPEATPSSAGGMPMDPNDRDLMIKTVYGEARGEPAAAQVGIAHSILNRVKAGGYGQGISGVVMAPAAGVNPARGFHEFSPWNPPGVPEGQTATLNALPTKNPKAYASIGDMVDKVYNGLIPDPTGGATHYYGVMPKPPKWAGPLAAQNSVKIGNTTFVGGAGGPGQNPIVAGLSNGV